jgi:hypothetical protein
MINPSLHRQPMAVDRNEHRFVRLKVPITDWSFAAGLNTMFLAATEMGDAAREFPVVFVNAGNGEDGKPEFATIAVLGLTKEQNLYVENGAWRARYMPALLRIYPFCIGRLDAERFAVCLDVGWAGVSGTEGERLFSAEGEPSPLLGDVRQQLENLDRETQRTRLLCRQLRDHGLLQDARFDAKLPDGSALGVDGFYTVDDAKLNALDDAAVVDLHKTGALGLVHAHYVSLGNMNRLLEWHAARLGADAAKA